MNELFHPKKKHLTVLSQPWQADGTLRPETSLSAVPEWPPEPLGWCRRGHRGL